jgi:hypothetical protein
MVKKKVDVYTNGEHVFIKLEGLHYAFDRVDSFKEDHPKLWEKMVEK